MMSDPTPEDVARLLRKQRADDDGVDYETDSDEDEYDHEFEAQCVNCGAAHSDCQCEDFEADDWCAECGELESDSVHG
jgi:hypothetical protein